MLNHPTLEKLTQLRLHSVAKALTDQQMLNNLESMDFEQRLGLLLDRELTDRENRRLAQRLRKATMRHNACLEDIDLRTTRGLDRTVILKLGECQWIQKHLNCLITGPTGIGKSYLACALGHKACLEGYTVKYYRLSQLLEALAVGHGDGSYTKLMTSLQKIDLIVIDDFGVTPLTAQNRRDLLEVLEDRFNRKSTLVTSQLPIEQWHDYIGDPTLADAILDRLVHSSYQLNLHGESMRKKLSPLRKEDESETL